MQAQPVLKPGELLPSVLRTSADLSASLQSKQPAAAAGECQTEIEGLTRRSTTSTLPEHAEGNLAMQAQHQQWLGRQMQSSWVANAPQQGLLPLESCWGLQHFQGVCVWFYM